MNIRNIHCWEKSYPDGLSWDVSIEPLSLPTMLARAVARHADRQAIEYRDHLISYPALGQAVDRFAAALLAHAGPGAALALYLPNSPYHPIGFFGGAKAGARLAHLSPLDAERELVHKLEDSGARILFTTNLPPLLPTALKLLDAGKIDLLIVGEDEVWGPAAVPHVEIPDRPGVVAYRRFTEAAEPPAAWPEPKASDVALLQYTSGTTGRPKGAILTHGNLTSAVQIYNAWFGAQERQLDPDNKQNRIICVLPLFHIYALTAVLLRQLDAGGLILLRPRFDMASVLHDIEIKRATIFPGVPTMWIALANHPGIEQRDLSSLIYCGSGGAPLPIEIANRFAALAGLALRGGWGMTETSSPGTALPLDGPSKPGTIGLPLPGIVIDIVSLSDANQVLPLGETGEIRVKGPNVTQGYWHHPEATAASYTDGGLLTGDIGYMDPDGYVFIVDRKKDMIISGGFNVYPQMIEQAIYEHPHVEEVLVIGIPDAYRGEAAKAFVKLRAEAPELTLEDLRIFLADKLGRYELPAALEIRAALPRTAVGKLSKKELRAS